MVPWTISRYEIRDTIVSKTSVDNFYVEDADHHRLRLRHFFPLELKKPEPYVRA